MPSRAAHTWLMLVLKLTVFEAIVIHRPVHG